MAWGIFQKHDSMLQYKISYAKKITHGITKVNDKSLRWKWQIHHLTTIMFYYLRLVDGHLLLERENQLYRNS